MTLEKKKKCKTTLSSNPQLGRTVAPQQHSSTVGKRSLPIAIGIETAFFPAYRQAGLVLSFWHGKRKYDHADQVIKKQTWQTGH